MARSDRSNYSTALQLTVNFKLRFENFTLFIMSSYFLIFQTDNSIVVGFPLPLTGQELSSFLVQKR